MVPQTAPMNMLYPDRKANRPAAFLIICHGFETTQKMEMISVARKMLMYLGERPETVS
jgi:hypothetical protein